MSNVNASSLNIAKALESMAHDVGDRNAFVLIGGKRSKPRYVTFAELHEQVAHCAGGMLRMGITRGERVVVFVPMSLELYVILLALFRIGAVAVFIDPWLGRATIDAATGLVEPTAFFGIPKAQALRAMSPALREISPSVIVSGGRVPVGRLVPGATDFRQVMRVAPGKRVHTAVDVTEDDPALITFTTGSTGMPKGANRTHGFLAAQNHVLSQHVNLGLDDIVLTNLPIVVLHNLGRGATTILPPRAAAQDAQPDGTWLHAMAKSNRATVLAMSPSPLDALTHSRDRSPLKLVHSAYSGGGPVLPDLLDRAQVMLPNATIMVFYGSTESEPIAHCTADEVRKRRQGVREHGGIYVGAPVPEVDVRLLRPTAGPIELVAGSTLDDWEVEPGAAGEVIVAGPHVNRDYYRNEAAFAENKIIDEHGRTWHRTGDMARAASDGGLWLLGRLTGAFKVKGQTVYPFEVETPLCELPEVARAAACTPKFEGSSREFKNAAAVIAVEPAPGYSRDQARIASLAYLHAIGYDD